MSSSWAIGNHTQKTGSLDCVKPDWMFASGEVIGNAPGVQAFAW